jgi:DNA-directed RNA polymerase omega subunit
MAVKAFPFEKLEGKVQNVYEAVIAAARRARQINDEQMIHVRTIMEGEEGEENDKINLDDLVDIDKLPKPVETALTELIEGKLKVEYVEK